MGYRILILSWWMAVAPTAHAQTGWLAITGGTLFDGTGVLHEDHTILIQGEVIRRVGPAAEVAIPTEAKVIEARGKFVMPGLVDLHFHFNVRRDPEVSPSLPLRFLAHGATTLREFGNWIVEENQKWQAEIERAGLPMPRLLYTGPVLDGPDTVIPSQSIILFDEMDARRATHWLIDRGATSLKVHSRLPLGLLRVVAQEAHRRNVPVHGHLAIVDHRDAIRAGLDGIEHTNTICQPLLPEMEAEAFRQKAFRERDPGTMEIWTNIDPMGSKADALIELMLEHEVNLDATLALHEPRLGAEGKEDRWKSLENLATFTVRYQQAGGSVTMGSHGKVPNAPAGLGLHREMEIHARHGMSPADVLLAATRVGAEVLRLEDRGVIAAGKLADILILDASPVEDIRNTQKIHAVILGGKPLDREALLKN